MASLGKTTKQMFSSFPYLLSFWGVTALKELPAGGEKLVKWRTYSSTEMLEMLPPRKGEQNVQKAQERGKEFTKNKGKLYCTRSIKVLVPC